MVTNLMGHPVMILSLPGLVNLRVAVDGLEAAPRGDDEDEARDSHLIPYVIRHSFAQLEVFPVPVNPRGMGSK